MSSPLVPSRLAGPLRHLFLLLAAVLLLSVAQAPTANAAVGYRASTCDTNAFFYFPPSTLSIGKPTGTVTGDLMVMTVLSDVGSGWSWDESAPSGWTPLLNSGTSVTYYKFAAAGEPTSYTVITGGFSAGKGGATISTFTGVDPSAPFATAGAIGTGSDNTAELPNTTAGRTGSMRFSSVTVGTARAATYPTGMTESADCAADGLGMSSGREAMDAGPTATRVVGLAGAGAWIAQTYVIQPPPPAPTVTALSPSAGPLAGANSVVITGTDFVGVTGAAGVKFGATNATSYTVNSPTQITATAPAGTGTQNVIVTATAGASANTSADDYTYQAAPTLTSISPADGPVAGGTVVTITGTNFIGLSGPAGVRFGTTNAATYTVNSATSITATAPAGTGVQDVRVTTPGGTTTNTSADDFTYLALPTVTSIAPSSGPGAGGTSVTITGTNFASLSGPAAVTFGGTNATSYTVNSATSITAIAPAGTGVQDVRVTTPGGTSANTSSDDYTYYDVPTIASITPGSGPATGGTVVTITGTGFGGLSGTAAVQFGTTNAASYTVVNSTTITATAPAGTGTQDIRVTTPGGTTANTGADDFTYIAVPAVTNLSPSSGPVAGGTAVTITGTDFIGLSGAAAVRFGAVNATNYTVNSATSITATAPAGTGAQDVRVTGAGGTSPNTTADDYAYFAVPTITALSPSTGPVAGGTTVTITGTNFAGLSGPAAVRFGAVNATNYTVNSATSITATAPAGTGTENVQVTTPGGTTANTPADDYTYFASPVISGISPGSGPGAGGVVVTITGSNFTGTTQVRFGGVNATGYTVVSATTITATAPAGVGTVDIRVTTPGGQSANTSADDFVYLDPPVVTAIAPSTGSAGGGTTVTITGSFFTGATQVRFGAVNATGYTVVSATQITATAPAGTGVVDVRVTTANGTSANTSADDFTYVPMPTITSVSPNQAVAIGGLAITITGTNFTGATSVVFGATNATGYTVLNSTTILATAPPHALGFVDVRVTTAGGQSANTAADDFEYIGACSTGGMGVTAQNVLFTPLMLNGLNQVGTATARIGVSDMTGAGAGWNLQIGTDQFTAGAGKVLAPNAAKIVGAHATSLGGTCTAPTLSLSTYPLTLPMNPSKVKVYNATVGTGSGPVDIDLDVKLDVPANTLFGTYQSTWSIDLTAAP